MSVYFLSNDNSDLTGGADFSKALVKVAPTSATLSIPIAAGATETSFAWTAAGEPGTTGITGNYTVSIIVTTGANNGALSISLSRVNSAGTVQTTSAATAEQTTSAGVKSYTLTAINLGTWAAGDRLRVNYIFRNTSTMTAITPGISTGNASGLGSPAVDVPWTIPIPSPLYWVGGAGAWAGVYGTRSWSSTSGGSPLDIFPDAATDVVFDAGSDVGSPFTVSVSNSPNCNNLTIAGLDAAMTLGMGGGSALNIYGNCSITPPNITFSATNPLAFLGTSSQTLNTGGVTVSGVARQSTGTLTLLSDLTVLGQVTVSQGTFNASTYNVTTPTVSISFSNTRTVNMGSGTWTLTGTGTVWNAVTTTNLTFNKGTADIVLSNNTTTARTFEGGGLTYNKLTIGGDTSTSTTSIRGSNTFSELASTKTVAHTVQFGSATTQNIGTWSINGSAGNVVSLRSTTPGAQYTLNKV